MYDNNGRRAASVPTSPHNWKHAPPNKGSPLGFIRCSNRGRYRKSPFFARSRTAANTIQGSSDWRAVALKRSNGGASEYLYPSESGMNVPLPIKDGRFQLCIKRL